MASRLRFTMLAIAAWTLCAAVISTPLPAEEELFAEGWRWATFTTESGLPSNDIRQLVETPRGATWVATQAGIAWFDGYRWIAIGTDRGLPLGRPQTLSAMGEDILVVVDSPPRSATAERGGRLYRGNQNGFALLLARPLGRDIAVADAVELSPDAVLILGRPKESPQDSLFAQIFEKIRQVLAPPVPPRAMTG